MIIVKAGLLLEPFGATKGAIAKVVGRAGYYLHYYTIDMTTGQFLEGGREPITSDPYETTVVWYVSDRTDYRTVYILCLDVEDGAGNKVETWKAPLIYAAGATRISIPTSEVVYISKTGVTVWNRNARSLYLDPRGYVFAIVRREGYAAIYEGTTLKAEYSGKAAIFELQFRVSADIAKLMANMIDDPSIIDIVYKAPELAEWLGAIAYVNRTATETRLSNIGTTVVRNADGSYTVTVRVQVDLYSQFDWQRFIHILAGVGSVVGGVLLLIASGGFSAPVSWAMIAAGITFIAAGIISLYDTSVNAPTHVKEKATTVVERAIREINTYVGSLDDYLKQLLAQGRITQDDYNTIMGYVNKVRDTAVGAMRELEKMVEKAYQEGYNKAKNEMTTWLVLAGMGGFIVGQMVSPVVVERVVPAVMERIAG
jgi:hypothetical protein